jgi:hypothetical protein
MFRHRHVLAILGAILLAGCTDTSVVRTQVGGMDFCVPKQNAIEVSGWVKHATEHLPDTGFAFLLPLGTLPQALGYVPSLSVRGDPLPLTGVVDVESSGVIDRPSADHHWVTYPRSQVASIVVDPSTRTLTAYEDSSRAYWVVWRIPDGQELSPNSLPDGARVLAACKRTVFGQSPSNKVHESTTCRRTIASNGLRIAYSFGAGNLARLPAIDAAVVDEVNSWSCHRAGAAYPLTGTSWPTTTPALYRSVERTRG